MTDKHPGDVEKALNIKKPAWRPYDPLVAEAKSFLLAWSYHQEIKDPANAERKAREDAIDRSVEAAAEKSPDLDRATVRKTIADALDRGEQTRRYPPVEIPGTSDAAKLRVVALRGGSPSAVEKAYRALRPRLESGGDLGEVATLVLEYLQQPSEEMRSAFKQATAAAAKKSLS